MEIVFSLDFTLNTTICRSNVKGLMTVNNKIIYHSL
jgi:hypothetical protein